jgi:uncharacterized protein (UPF0305 family)
MSRKKGSIKTGGRVRGTPNKTTTEVREWLAYLIDKNRLQMERDIKALEPKDRLLILERFMQYTIPKMQTIQTQIDYTKLSDSQLNSLINELSKKIGNE